MILDTLDAIGKYAGISPNFETAVRWLQETESWVNTWSGRRARSGRSSRKTCWSRRSRPLRYTAAMRTSRSFCGAGKASGTAGKERNSPESRRTTSGSAKRTGRYPLSWKKADSRFSCRERRMPPGFIPKKAKGFCPPPGPLRTGRLL